MLRKTWLANKIMAAVLITVIFLTTNAVLSPVNAASLSSSYQILKKDPANQKFIQTIIDNGATEAQIESFLNDLDAEVAKAGTITEANFDAIMYQALKEVLAWRNNRAILQALMDGFSEEIDYTLANHKLHPNLMPLRNAVRDSILGVPSPPSGGGGGSAQPNQDAISQEIDRQLALQGSIVKLSCDPISGEIIIPPAAIQKIITSGRELQISNANVIMTIPISSLPSGINVNQKIIVLKRNASESAEILQKRSDNLIVLSNVYEITSAPAVQWSKPITITISFTAADLSLINTEKIDGYYFNESTKKWEAMNGQLDLNAKKISFNTNHFSKYTVMAEKTSSVVTPPEPVDPDPIVPILTFEDINGHWAKSIIEKMAGLGMVSGMSTTQFAPERTVTRAEFATLLVKALDIKPSMQLIGRFNDVPKDKWYFPTVNTAASAGLISGYSGSRFGPDDPVSREQMAVMITKALAYKGQNNTLNEATTASILTGLNDKNAISPWARSGVALMLQQGIMKGRGNAAFAPRANATRAEATVLIHQMAQYLKIVK